MYGVTYICACDGYSGKIIGFASMPIKNNLEIYEHVIRLAYYIYMQTVIVIQQL